MPANTPSRGYTYATSGDANDLGLITQRLAEQLDADLSAIVAAHNLIGTVISAESGTAQDGTIGTPAVYASAEITLPAGTWQVTGGGSLTNLSTVDTASVALWNQTTGTLVPASRSGAGPTSTVAGTGVSSLTTRPVVMTVTSDTKVRVQGAPNGGSAIAFRSGAGAPAGWLTAVRLK